MNRADFIIALQARLIPQPPKPILLLWKERAIK